jgi:outer membrane lipoprotein-sorting protein
MFFVMFKVVFAGTGIGMLLLCLTATVAAQQLPNVTDLLKDVRAHQQKLDDIRENYTFHQIVKTDELDAKGAIKKTTSEEREVFFVNGRRVGRLVKKDGVALSPADEKKEQGRIEKLVGQRSKQPRGQPGSRGGLISMILPVAKVSNPRRTTLKGRASLAYDFAGDPAAHARNMEENALKKTAGTIWFDEADRQVARVEIHFFDNFRIAGGLIASVRKGTSIEVEQSPVGEGLWMQTSLEQHVGARLGFVSTREDEHVTNFDFKKFDVGMHQEIHPD